MNVLITGGAGFIGSHIVERLIARGDQVLVIDNYETGRRDNLQPHENLTVIEGDIAEADVVTDAFERIKPELVIHAAASYKDPEAWERDVRTNVTGTVNVVQSAKAVGTARIIYFQTALCYGLKPEEQPITLSHKIDSYGSSYAISKTAAEQYIDLSGIEYVSFRLANAYGPRNLSGPLPTFYHRLTNDKPCFVMDTRRDFIFIDDMIDCVMHAVDGKGKGAYHISSGSDVSIEELYRATLKALGMPEDSEVERRERHPDDAFSILLDPSRVNDEFGWSVKTDLNDGVPKTIAWYKKFGITQTFTHLAQPDQEKG